MSSYTEVTRQSWLSRLGQSIKNVVGGLIILLIAASLLFWNEGRAVKRAKALKEGKGQVESIQPDLWTQQSDNTLLHVSGPILAGSELSDLEFNVVTKALRLRRNVETYQWQEKVSTSKDKKLGGAEETTREYTYEKVWSESKINSGSFKVQEGHQNPSSQAYSSYTKNASDAMMGPIEIHDPLFSHLNAFEPVEAGSEVGLPSGQLATWNGHDTRGVYIGNGSPELPSIGDTRISFSMVPEGTYSIVGQKNGNAFAPFVASNGNKVLLMKEGSVPADVMFAAAQQANKTALWVLRFVGLMIMFFGWRIIAKPIIVVGDVVPFIGNILSLGLSVFSGVMAFTFSVVIIALGWMTYRPMLSIILLVIGVGVFLYFRRRGKSGDPVAVA